MLGNEIDLLKNYPKSKRDIKGRAQIITEKDKEIARQYGYDFFDGDRTYGYGGYSYMARFWEPVVPDFKEYYQLDANSSMLDIGCAKGFTLFDFQRLIPGLKITGLDISEYALEQALEEVKPFLSLGNAKALPYEDNSFDLVISINSVHNLNREECAMAIKEIERVSRGKSFITVDAYRNDEEKARMMEWALTAKTIMHVDEWKAFFDECGYTGDFYWFIP